MPFEIPAVVIPVNRDVRFAVTITPESEEDGVVPVSVMGEQLMGAVEQFVASMQQEGVLPPGAVKTVLELDDSYSIGLRWAMDGDDSAGDQDVDDEEPVPDEEPTEPDDLTPDSPPPDE